MLELNTQLANTALFSLEAPMARGTEAQRAARRAVLDRFMGTYPSLVEGAPHARVWLAFHVGAGVGGLFRNGHVESTPLFRKALLRRPPSGSSTHVVACRMACLASSL